MTRFGWFDRTGCGFDLANFCTMDSFEFLVQESAPEPYRVSSVEAERIKEALSSAKQTLSEFLLD